MAKRGLEAGQRPAQEVFLGFLFLAQGCVPDPQQEDLQLPGARLRNGARSANIFLTLSSVFLLSLHTRGNAFWHLQISTSLFRPLVMQLNKCLHIHNLFHILYP